MTTEAFTEGSFAITSTKDEWLAGEGGRKGVDSSDDSMVGQTAFHLGNAMILTCSCIHRHSHPCTSGSKKQ